MQTTVINIDQARKATAMQAAHHLYEQMQVMEKHRAAVQTSGLPALSRLVAIAQRDTGQGRIVGRFLLGLYNGPENPFDLTELRCLDHELFNDCLRVLRMDNQPTHEVHEYLPNGSSIFAELHQAYGKGGAA